MKITFEHTGVLPVKEYGGIERMIYWHMLELKRLGHQITLIGHPKSDVEKHGIELIPHSGDSNWWKLIPSDSDIVQLFYNTQLPIDIPVVISMGCNGQPGEVFSKNSVFVSKNHAKDHGSDIFVYNGIDLNEYPFLPKKNPGWDSFLFLAKASWRVKNLKSCVRVCKKLKKDLHIAGGNYFLPSRYIHGHGMVGGEKKLELIRSADALLFPIRWPEPFGLAMVEAMSQGVPVIGSSYGSLPEIIVQGTGFTCHNEAEFFDKIRDTQNKFDPEFIRSHVEKNFSIQQFSQKYVEIFEKVLRDGDLHQENPQYQKKNRAETLLPF